MGLRKQSKNTYEEEARDEEVVQAGGNRYELRDASKTDISHIPTQGLKKYNPDLLVRHSSP